MGQFIAGLIVLWCIAAMVAHIYTCVVTDWATMLILGLFFFPVGIVHGSGIILGLW